MRNIKFKNLTLLESKQISGGQSVAYAVGYALGKAWKYFTDSLNIPV